MLQSTSVSLVKRDAGPTVAAHLHAPHLVSAVVAPRKPQDALLDKCMLFEALGSFWGSRGLGAALCRLGLEPFESAAFSDRGLGLGRLDLVLFFGDRQSARRGCGCHGGIDRGGGAHRRDAGARSGIRGAGLDAKLFERARDGAETELGGDIGRAAGHVGQGGTKGSGGGCAGRLLFELALNVGVELCELFVAGVECGCLFEKDVAVFLELCDLLDEAFALELEGLEVLAVLLAQGFEAGLERLEAVSGRG